MKRATALALIVSAIVVGVSDRARAQSPMPGRYAPIEFVVGSCWIGTFGGTTTDTHCFEWVYDRKFIRDRHVVSSTPTYEGETMYVWDPASKTIVFRYLGNQGLVLDGSVDQRGDTIVFPGAYLNANGQKMTSRAEWTRVDENTYRATNREMTPDGWKVLFVVDYRRSR